MIPVNLICGFLGVGKTTLIRHLLKHHPREERWAVLVNEFGEIGVDGGLLADQGVVIEEVAGGCLCCVAAPAFSVGLNRLIRHHRPERILIEPSGLGHPAQVLDTLRSPLYQQVVQIQATLCVMDARHLDSPRHREHPNFIDQIHLADILVANKADRYSEHNEHALLEFAATLSPPKSRLVITQQGRVSPQILMLEGQTRAAAFPEAHAFLLQQQNTQGHATQEDWLEFEGQGDGYFRLGYQIDRQHCFDHDRLLAWLDGLQVQRIKGLFNSNQGWFSYNRSTDLAAVMQTAAAQHSRIQLIDNRSFDASRIDADLRSLLILETSS